MGFRFGKSISLGKGIRLNISKGGLGISAGVKGFRVGVGPRGARLTTGIPGTGVSYSTQLGGGSGRARGGSRAKTQGADHPPSIPMPQVPPPDSLAPQHEKDFVRGVIDYRAGRTDESLRHFLAAGQKDAGGGLYAATLLASRRGGEPQATAWLESIVRADVDFPMPLMEKYRTKDALNISVTPSVVATVPFDGLGAALLLAELYQKQGRLEEAVGVLEEVEEIAGEPVVTLSLCELYAHRGLWDGVIERAKGCAAVDDVTLETAILYGRALQEKGMHDAAIAVFTGALRSRKNRSRQLLNEGRYWRAVSYELAGKRSQANREFQRLYAEAPDFRDVAQRAVGTLAPAGPAGDSTRGRKNNTSPGGDLALNHGCVTCGHPIDRGHNFCGQCGSPVESLPR
jgi:tetratricopeptide (TPR) repeat protein